MDSKSVIGVIASQFTTKTKAASVPICTVIIKSNDTILKPHLSAPSYFSSLKENDAPPFARPGRQEHARLLLGTIMSKEEAIAMIASADADQVNGLKKFLGNFLVEKKIIVNYNLPEKNFLVNFLMETIDYGAQRDFTADKLASLITIYLSCHLYFKAYYWQLPSTVWLYCKELMIRHTIEDSPDGQEIFDPEESYDIISHFHTMYLSNSALVHLLTFGAYRLKFSWPFKP